MKLTLVAALVVCIATQAFGQTDPCGGNGGQGHLETTPLAIGTTVTCSVTGGANQAFALFTGDLAVTFWPGVGTGCLEPSSFALLLTGTLPPSGGVDLPFYIPNAPEWLTLVTYVQGLVLDPPAPSGVAITNEFRADFEAQDSWVSVTPSLQNGRAFSTATRLANGWVLVAGGGSAPPTALASPSASTDFYVPWLRSFVVGPPLLQPRMLHTATTLLDGRILIAAGIVPGFLGSAETATCEIYDPATETFVPAASMSVARRFHSATRLADGRVLVIGGTGSAGPGNAEIYVPLVDVWTPVANTLPGPRGHVGLATLADGRALVVSGSAGQFTCFTALANTTACDFYDPASNQFTAAPPLPGPGVANPEVTTLQDGTLFVSGGQLQIASCAGVPALGSSATYFFDGAAWSSGPSLPVGVMLHRQVLLKNGGVLVTGGAHASNTLPSYTAGMQLSDQCGRVLGGVLQIRASLPQPRYGHVAIRLEDGSVLVAGGYVGFPPSPTPVLTSTALLYTPDP